MKQKKTASGGARRETPGRDRHQSRVPDYRRTAHEWLRIHFRRWSCVLHDAASVHRTMAPLSFLIVSAVVGVSAVLGVLYSTSYAVTVDGRSLGVVADRQTVNSIIQTVEQHGQALLGRDYHVSGDVDCHFTLSLKSDLSDGKELENYFYEQLGTVSSDLRRYLLRLDGVQMGVVKDQNGLMSLLDRIKRSYFTPNTVHSGFVEQLTLDAVYSDAGLVTLGQLESALKENTTGETTYTVKEGDTFNAIAYANDMAASDLKALNPGIDVNRLAVGDILNVKEIVPVLSVWTMDHERYTEPIPCPVVTQEDPTIYKGNSKIVSAGTEGLAAVEANVKYVNGHERDREILSTTTLKEPTPTLKAVGTKPRPKTASTGKYRWPLRGKITSYFGSRYIFGRYSFHSGIDIAAPYGTPIKASDGGKVTFSGWKGGYGKLVIITHDNGTQTYYGHNSSLLVSAGQKVYKGQTIAKCGSTGRSTGNHCHFEVRVNRKAVNPLNYLP